ncbi:MAG TPA: hypothetical protein VFQ53_07810 [Kofleriaceae bacterium]|nr:hypothetical protein [Kofleriaceae bacterium]
MRAILVALILVAGCSKKSNDAPKQTDPVPTTASGSATMGSGAGSDPVAKPDQPAGGSDYADHMKKGDELETKRQWGDALVEFEAALKAKPDDPKALAEIGFNAYKAGKLDRAKEASEAAITKATDDKLKGSAMFNLGLAIEKDHPHAAESLYAASNKIRPNAAVAARLARLLSDPKAQKPTKDGDALLAKLKIDPMQAVAGRKPPKPDDAELERIFDEAGVGWQGATGKMVAVADNVSCTEAKDKSATCTMEADIMKGDDLDHGKLDVTGDTAKRLVANLVKRKIKGKKNGDSTVYAVASLRCTSHNVEAGPDAKIPPDDCEATP